MSFPKKPQFTKGQIKKAGDVLREFERTGIIPSAIHSSGIAEAWRACHAYPINTFRATLSRKISKLRLRESTVAQRLKRMPTILNKLVREPSMNLDRMQDIGGVRAILRSYRDVKRLVNEYKRKNSRFYHELHKEKDYITHPKPDGYRGVHLIYKYNNPQKQGREYKGLLLELQIRTRHQHAWNCR